MDAKYVKQREDQAKMSVKALEDLISDKTAEQMLQELTSSEKKWNSQDLYRSGSALNAKLAQEDPAKALTLLLQACLKAKDDQLIEREKFMQGLIEKIITDARNTKQLLASQINHLQKQLHAPNKEEEVKFDDVNFTETKQDQTTDI